MKPKECIGCPAFTSPGPIWADGPTDPELIIVGEAPGRDELLQEKPFVGSSGGLLWFMGSRVGVYRRKCYVTNTAKCLTKDFAAMKFCSQHYLFKEIERFPNVPVIALGDFAKTILVPELNGFTITAARGSRVGRVMCALHPAYIRRTLQKTSDEEKQDLTPTLAWDLSEARNRQWVEKRVYVNQVPSINIMGNFISCDLETANTLDPRQGPIDQIGFGVAPGLAYRENYDESKRSLYQQWFDSGPVVFHNMLFDVDWLEYNGYRIKEPHCSLLGSHLLDPDFPLGLDFVNTLYVHYPPWKSTKRRNPHNYHATDLDVTWQAWDRMVVELKRRGLWSLYEQETLPVTKVCLKMKQRGIRIDRMKMYKLNIAFTRRVEQIDAALNKVAPIDWASPQQIMHLFYDVLKLPVQRHRKTAKPTTSKEALETLAETTDNPVVKLLMTRRAYDKMRSTYSDYTLDDKDYFHGDISFTAATGRARGFLMTLQKGAMRSLFVPDEPDWEMLYADWDRVELWISAVLSNDLEFQRVLTEVNFHEYAATNVFGYRVDKKSHPDKYHEAKFISHGINYGRGEKSILRDHGVPVETTRKFTTWMRVTFPRWWAWREAQLSHARSEGYLETPFGFRRYFWSGNIPGMAYSFGPQATPAHMLKRILIQTETQLPKPARVILPYHDALLVAYPLEIKKQVVECVTDLMEQKWPQLGGWSAKCSIGYGKNFQEASDG